MAAGEEEEGGVRELTAEERLADRMGELVRYMAEGLVSEDTEVDVQAHPRGQEIRVELRVPAKVRGKVIGRGGRIVRSMRNILEVAKFDTVPNVSLDIVD